jgi:hypothetical protein
MKPNTKHTTAAIALGVDNVKLPYKCNAMTDTADEDNDDLIKWIIDYIQVIRPKLE